jgi:hypothetical protein
MKLRAALFLVAISFPFLCAQQQAPAPPPQTARQALIEIITGGQEGAKRHLTLEMQKSIQADKKNDFSQNFSMLDQIKSTSSDFQTFETGQVLLATTDPKTHEKVDVHVDSDDLSGDTDNIDLSFHQFRDGVELDIPYTALLSRFTIGFKRQENIWRLNEISANIKVPVGDPRLLEKIENSDGMIGGKLSTDGTGKPSAPRTMPIEQTMTMVALAEGSYATTHPETGFTCTLTDLAKPNPFNLDPRIFNGEGYHGYKFSLSGCEGKPVGSFHLAAEPVSPAAGARAYCTDATRNVRTSDDGRGSTCLTSGKMRNFGGEGVYGIGLSATSSGNDKPQEK